MRHIALLWLCVASCTPTPSAFAAFPHVSTTAGPGIIHGCYDGDTCTITIPGLPSVFGDKLGLWLVGIDTPEMKGKCDEERALAKQAKAFLNSRLEAAQDISVEFVARDKYFRVLALIIADGMDLADAMVEAGHGTITAISSRAGVQQGLPMTFIQQG